MKTIIIISLALAGCMNMPPEKISQASSQKLCTQSGYVAVSEENRELMYKELERRGVQCQARYIPPPPQYQPAYVPPVQTRQQTNCTSTKIGNQVHTNCY